MNSKCTSHYMSPEVRIIKIPRSICKKQEGRCHHKGPTTTPQINYQKYEVAMISTFFQQSNLCDFVQFPTTSRRVKEPVFGRKNRSSHLLMPSCCRRLECSNFTRL